jgi:hypothetical protein
MNWLRARWRWLLAWLLGSLGLALLVDALIPDLYDPRLLLVASLALGLAGLMLARKV